MNQLFELFLVVFFGFEAYILELTTFVTIIANYSYLRSEMEKRADTADISVLFLFNMC